MHDHGISIWFFIGLSLLVNGILITGAGIWELISPPANRVVLVPVSRQRLVGSVPPTGGRALLRAVCAQETRLACWA